MMFLIAAIVMYQDPFVFLVFLIVTAMMMYGYRNKYVWIEIDGDEIILKKIFKTAHLHRIDIEAYSEWNRHYGKSGTYKELVLHTNHEDYTVVGGFFKNYDEIRANLITPKLQNRTQESLEKAYQKSRWVAIIFFISATVLLFIANEEKQKFVIEEKDVKYIKGELSFNPKLKSRKKNKYSRENYLVLQIKDCNRFFHIYEPLLGNLPTQISSTKSIAYSYFNIKDSVEICYVDRHSKVDLKAHVYGLKHKKTTFFWKNWDEIKLIIESKNHTVWLLVLLRVATFGRFYRFRLYFKMV